MTFYSLTIIFRPSVAKSRYIVQVHENSTVRDVLLDVCRQAYFAQSNNCFLWFNSEELPLEKKIRYVGLYPPSSTGKDFAEVRLKFVHQLQESLHIEKKILIIFY